MSIREAQKLYAVYSEGLPFADCDLLAASMPYPVLLRAYQLSTAEMREADRELLRAWRRAASVSPPARTIPASR